MIVRCGFGLGNRVAAMANGLSRADRIEFVWRNNAHCPADWQDVFPHGIERVEFIEAPPDRASMWDGKHCEDWHAAGDRTAANDAYGAIMAAMVGEAQYAPELTVFARFHRRQTVTHEILANAAMGWRSVFIMADSRRAELVAALNRNLIHAVPPACPELSSDLDGRKESLMDFISDWKTMLASRAILTTRDKSSLLHPAMAAGVSIIRVTSGDG